MLGNISIIIKGAGEMASGIAWRLYRSGLCNIILLDTETPLAVRRTVSFSEAVYDGTHEVDGVRAQIAEKAEDIDRILAQKELPVVVDPAWRTISRRSPDVVIDAILAKRNLGTGLDDAQLVIGLGPGFTAGKDAHVVIETNRGPNCGRLIYSGSAEKNTGIPGMIGQAGIERVIRSPTGGLFLASVTIGDQVQPGSIVGMVDSTPVRAGLAGRIRGLLRDRTPVMKNCKLGDIEPRENINNMLVSDKALGLGGAALEAILARYNR